MALMGFYEWGKYVGLSVTQAWRLRTAGRIKGLLEIGKSIIVDTDTVEILPPPNKERRTDGVVIGRFKPLRGEKNFGRPDWKTCKD